MVSKCAPVPVPSRTPLSEPATRVAVDRDAIRLRELGVGANAVDVTGSVGDVPGERDEVAGGHVEAAHRAHVAEVDVARAVVREVVRAVESRGRAAAVGGAADAEVAGDERE